jgi:DNA-binding SARP family transcriptional activator
VLRINTFGGLSVWAGDSQITGPAVQPRRLAVLALLARAGARGMSREKVLGLIWPGVETDRSRRLLTQALYAVRRELRADDAIVGMQELRLNTQLVTCDVVEFTDAIAEGRLDRAAALYGGPFADGFRLAGAADFERWVEEERVTLAHAFHNAVEKLAKQATASGEHAAAAEWWRKLAAQDPLNARVALGFMHALAAVGDRLGAIQHARIYEELIAQDLGMAPDAEVVKLAAKLREQQTLHRAATAPDRPPIAALAPVASSPPMSALPDSRGASTLDGPAAILEVRRRRALSPPTLVVATIVGLVLVALVGYGAHGWATRNEHRAVPVIAVGRIAEYRTTPASDVARPLADMLATNLAGAPGIRVVSTARIFELMRQLGITNDTSGGGHVRAARQAGATQVLDGALFELDDGRLRLDLRLVDLATGDVLKGYSVSGADPFALADSGTAQIVAEAGLATPAGSLADRTTRSLTAYRLYEEGLRRFVAGDSAAARSLLGAALAADSNFAMAAFYLARATETGAKHFALLGRAEALARRAPERERLSIQAGWAHELGSPQLFAFAETLAVRYPDEVDGHFYAGASAVLEGRFAAAIPYLNRVIEMDSLGLRGSVAGCTACDAFLYLVSAYQMMDSFPQAIREGRRLTRLQPRSARGWQLLADVLDQAGHGAEALEAQRTFASLGTTPDGGLTLLALHHLRAGRYDEAERMLRQLAQSADSVVRGDGLWYTAIALRQRGRPTEALAQARLFRRSSRVDTPFRQPALWNASMEAQVLFELGRYAQAAALFDTIAHIPGSELPSMRARNVAWSLTHAATARAAMGDTSRLPWLADTIESLGALTGRGRDRRLHHHVRGLLWLARDRPTEAVSELQKAMYSVTQGYTRTNYELAKLYLRFGRPRDAVAILQPAFRGSLEASNLYITRTELHELLAQAHDSAGARDSAATHYAAVVDAWRDAEPRFLSRRDAARNRLQALRTSHR